MGAKPRQKASAFGPELTHRLSIRVTKKGHRALKQYATRSDTFIQHLVVELIFKGIGREDLIPRTSPD